MPHVIKAYQNLNRASAGGGAFKKQAAGPGAGAGAGGAGAGGGKGMMLSELHKRSALHSRIELEQLHFAELLKKVGLVAKSAAFTTLPALADFVQRLDVLLGRLSDERGVLKAGPSILYSPHTAFKPSNSKP